MPFHSCSCDWLSLWSFKATEQLQNSFKLYITVFANHTKCLVSVKWKNSDIKFRRVLQLFCSFKDFRIRSFWVILELCASSGNSKKVETKRGFVTALQNRSHKNVHYRLLWQIVLTLLCPRTSSKTLVLLYTTRAAITFIWKNFSSQTAFFCSIKYLLDGEWCKIQDWHFPVGFTNCLKSFRK